MSEKLPTIADLRSRGFKVRVYHWRLENGIFYRQSIKFIKRHINEFLHPQKDIAGEFISPTGGKISIHLESVDGRISKGASVCSPYDAFVRKTGLRIALVRALENLNQIPIEGLPS